MWRMQGGEVSVCVYACVCVGGGGVMVSGSRHRGVLLFLLFGRHGVCAVLAYTPTAHCMLKRMQLKL